MPCAVHQFFNTSYNLLRKSIAAARCDIHSLFSGISVPYETFRLFLLIAIIAGCSDNGDQRLALEEIKSRKLTYNIAGLKKATRNPDEDGAFIFEAAGFFEDISDEQYKELVIHACTNNNFGLVTRLLKIDRIGLFQAGELRELTDEAIEGGFSGQLSLLVKNGATIGSGSLFKSIYSDSYDLVRLILDKGPPFNSEEYEEALFVAARIGHLNAITSIIDSDKAPRHAIENAILGGALTEEIDVVRYLVEQGVDINYPARDKCTPLHYLAQDGTVQMIEFMIDSGANVNAHCRGQETPLQWAYFGKNQDVIEYLEENGAIKN